MDQWVIEGHQQLLGKRVLRGKPHQFVGQDTVIMNYTDSKWRHCVILQFIREHRYGPDWVLQTPLKIGWSYILRTSAMERAGMV